MPTTRDLMMATLHARIAWFRQAQRPSAIIDDTGRARAPRRPLHLHPVAYLRLSNRDEDEVILRPVMWTLFDL